MADRQDLFSANLDWHFGDFDELDPSTSFLEDPALLSTFTPDWSKSISEVCTQKDVAVTSNEASSDEEDCISTPAAVRSGKGITLDSNAKPSGDTTWEEYISNFMARGDTESLSNSKSSVPISSTGSIQSTLRFNTRSSNAPTAMMYKRTESPVYPRSSQTGRKKATEEAREILMDWINENREHPYPSRTQKSELAERTGLTVAQIVHWMSNVRKRRLIPLMRGNREPKSRIDRKFIADMAKRAQQK